MDNTDKNVIDKNILASTHISFLFGAGVNGSALPQLGDFSETYCKLEEFGVDISSGIEAAIDKIEDDEKRSSVKEVFINEFQNPHDLNKIRKAVAFLDQNAMDSLTVLGPGECIVSGSGIKMPSFIKIEQLEKQFRPNSENVILFGEEGIFESV